MTKCLVEIGELLFTQPVLTCRGDTRQRFWGGAVHVSDHRIGRHTGGLGVNQTAINGDEFRSKA